MEALQADNDSHLTKPCLEPINKYLKVFKIVGGFPLTINKSKITFSKFEFFKVVTHFILASVFMNTFAIYMLTIPEKHLLIHMTIFKSVGYSSIDFVVGVVMSAINTTSSFVNFISLKSISQKLDKLIKELDDFNAKNEIYSTQTYNGKRKHILLDHNFNTL